MILSQSSSVTSSNSPKIATPALLNMKSSRPCSATIASMPAAMSSREETSIGRVVMPSSRAVASSASPGRSLAVTCAPAAASCRAISRPIPLAAPVTKAVLPAKCSCTRRSVWSRALVSGQRIDPGGRKEIGLPLWLFARAGGIVSRTNPPNLFTTLGRNRGLFRGWLGFARKLMPFGKLPRRESEIVILRVAHLRASEYEWKHHLRLGRRVGLGNADFERIQTGPSAGGWSPRELAILNAVQELHEQTDVT